MSLGVAINGAIFSVLFFSGVTPVPSFDIGDGAVPPGTASVSYTVYDEDVLSDDILEQGGVATHSVDPVTGQGKWSTGNISLWCPPPDCNDVTGSAGSSGESTAEVKVVWTFKNSQGQVIGTAQSGTKSASCDCN